MLYNNQCTTTTALIVPNRDALRRYLKENNIKAECEEGRKAALMKLESELARFKKGGEFQGMFPERWLPSSFAVLAEPFTEQNQMINSTMKMVRPKIEKAYKERIDYMYSSEGKQTLNAQNMQSVL
jgi:long-chain acyl-CoA synthetase